MHSLILGELSTGTSQTVCDSNVCLAKIFWSSKQQQLWRDTAQLKLRNYLLSFKGKGAGTYLLGTLLLAPLSWAPIPWAPFSWAPISVAPLSWAPLSWHLSPGHITPRHLSPGHITPRHLSPGHLSPGHLSIHIIHWAAGVTEMLKCISAL